MEPKAALLALVRQQLWAILPNYLDVIEAIVMRAYDHPDVLAVALDGHQARLAAAVEAVAAVGARLEGTMTATVRDGTAVLPVFGPIFPRANMINASTDGTSLDVLMRDFRAAQAHSSVDRILMLFDTPGGVVSGLAEAADALRASSKPLTAFVTGMAASAGYWLASQANEIVVERAAQLGSIGVLVSARHQVEPDANGTMPVEIVSANAPNKRTELGTDEGRAPLQALVDAAEQVFIADVAKGRKVSAATVRSDFGRGGLLLGAAAVQAGMADRIGTLEGVLSQIGRTRSSSGNRRARAMAMVETRRRAATLEN